MKELIEILFSIVNGPLSILLLGLIIYWLFTAFGVFDMDSFDIDVDVDVDVDLDMDLDVDSDISTKDFSGARAEDVRSGRRRKLSVLEVFLVFFHFIEVPFMMAFTIFVFVWWFLTVFFTEMLGLDHSWFGYAILVLSVLPALFIMKFLTYPLKSLLKKFNPKGVENLEMEGRVAQTITQVSFNKLGQVQMLIDDSPIKVYAMSINKDQVIPANTEVLIIKKSADSKYYLIDINS